MMQNTLLCMPAFYKQVWFILCKLCAAISLVSIFHFPIPSLMSIAFANSISSFGLCISLESQKTDNCLTLYVNMSLNLAVGNILNISLALRHIHVRDLLWHWTNSLSLFPSSPPFNIFAFSHSHCKCYLLLRIMMLIILSNQCLPFGWWTKCYLHSQFTYTIIQQMYHMIQQFLVFVSSRP